MLSAAITTQQRYVPTEGPSLKPEFGTFRLKIRTTLNIAAQTYVGRQPDTTVTSLLIHEYAVLFLRCSKSKFTFSF
jgi:hypothetical protein